MLRATMVSPCSLSSLSTHCHFFLVSVRPATLSLSNLVPCFPSAISGWVPNNSDSLSHHYQSCPFPLRLFHFIRCHTPSAMATISIIFLTQLLYFIHPKMCYNWLACLAPFLNRLLQTGTICIFMSLLDTEIPTSTCMRQFLPVSNYVYLLEKCCAPSRYSTNTILFTQKTLQSQISAPIPHRRSDC